MNRNVLHNAVEHHVAEAYGRLVLHYPDFCGCEMCRLDAMGYALNRLPARYVVGLEGSVVTDVNLDKDQSRASIEVAVMEGIRKINLAPRCGRKASPK